MNDHPSQSGLHVPAAPLAAIMQAIAASLDVSQIFTIVAEEVGHILTHDALAVLLQPSAQAAQDQDAEDARELAVAFCHPPIVETGRSWPLTEFSFGQDLLTNQPAVIADFETTATHYAGDQLFLELAGRAGVIVPIQAAPHVLGGLILVSQDAGLYNKDDALLVEPIANLLALALEHQRLDERARILAVAEERNRLAREIHDTLAQSLTSIIINLESLKFYKAKRSQGEADVLAETEALARGALEEARRSVLELQPTPLQHRTLRDALAIVLAELAKRGALATQFYVNGTESPLAPDIATALFRVAQEAFHNIYKHAGARQVILDLTFDGRDVILTVEDDGAGFTPAEPGTRVPDAAGGFGLLGMAARARRLGGELLVSSRPGHGTIVRATLPYTRSGIAMAAVLLPDTPSNFSSEPSLETRPIRVVVVDDHSVVRQGIKHILNEQPDIQVVGEAEDGLGAVEQVARLQPDVVLLDLRLPRLSGIEALPRLRAAHASVEVVMLTVFDQDEELFASLKAGARGYILKDATPAMIIAAVRAASHGQSALAPSLATRIVERFTVLAQREVDPDALTEREVEILGFVAQGMPYKQIGAQLNIATKTVQFHVRNILQKLHVGSRGEAVAIAVERGLLHRTQ